MTSLDSSGYFAVALLIVALTLPVTFLYVLPALITWWRLFTKVGQPGWAAIVPVYSSIVMARIGFQPKGLGIAAGVMPVIAIFLSEELSVLLHVNPVLLILLLTLATLALFIYLLLPMTKRYDRGVGFWVLVLLLPIVAVFLVGKAKLIEAPTPAATALPPPIPSA
jgi:hypothetical protein